MISLFFTVRFSKVRFEKFEHCKSFLPFLSTTFVFDISFSINNKYFKTFLTLLFLIFYIGDNLCSDNNGRCQQLCFQTNLTERRCACESHYTLNPSNSTTCLGMIFLYSAVDTLKYLTCQNLICLNCKLMILKSILVKFSLN